MRRATPRSPKRKQADSRKGKRCALGHCALAAEESPTLPSVHPTFPRSSTHRRRLSAAAVCQYGAATAVIHLRRAFNPTFFVRSWMKTFLDLFLNTSVHRPTRMEPSLTYYARHSNPPDSCKNLNQIYLSVASIWRDFFLGIFLFLGECFSPDSGTF